MNQTIDKKALLEKCKDMLNNRIQNVQQAMNNAQESTISEDKSSAGDKFETSRAMGHMNKEMYAKQMVLLRQELELLNHLKLQNQYQKVSLGAMVFTNQSVLFIAIGLGKITIGNQDIIAISPLSPLGKLLAFKSVGDTYILNNSHYEILAIS